ncbi:hypothetical protein M2351_002136 [Azospirillum canadense]|nr:hypothetical protein [Azospirillum canadense]
MPTMAVGAGDLHLVDALLDFGKVGVAPRFVAGAHRLVLDGDGRLAVIDRVEATGHQPGLRDGPLPRAEHGLQVVFLRRGVDLVQDVADLARVGAVHRLGHQMLQRVLHRPGFRMAAVEEDQDEVRQLDDVVDQPQDGAALVVGVEARRVDEDLAARPFAGQRLQLQIVVDALALPGRDLFDLVGDPVEGEARVGVQRSAGQRLAPRLRPVADDREFVVHRLVAGVLQRRAEIAVQEGRLAGREGAEHRDHRPPWDARGQRFVPAQHAQPGQQPVELAEGRDHRKKVRVLRAEVRVQGREALLEGLPGGHGRRVPVSCEDKGATTGLCQEPLSSTSRRGGGE